MGAPSRQAATGLQLEREPVRHDLRAGVAFERRHGLDRPPKTRGRCGPRRTPSVSPPSSGFMSAFARTPLVRARKQYAKVTKQRRQRPKPARKLVPIRASAHQNLGAVEPTPRIASMRRRPEAGRRPRPAPRRFPPNRLPAPRRRCRQRLTRQHALRLQYTRGPRSAPQQRQRRASRPKRSRWQRDVTVGSRTSGLDVTSTNVDADGGSSSVLRRAFWASTSTASASSMMTTRRRPSNGR